MAIPEHLLNTITTGDARELSKQIPDESIDLIFTDPPYPREFLPLYAWLAEEAARVLRPGGLCFAMAGQSYLPEIYRMMGTHLEYHWTFNMPTPGEACTIWPRRVSPGWKPILSWSKGTYNGPWWGVDVISSTMNDKRYHHWGQSISSAIAVISRVPGLVLEPFTGGGTTPAACKILERDFVAFEVDPAVADTARGRLADTPLPLPGLVYEQMELTA